MIIATNNSLEIEIIHWGKTVEMSIEKSLRQERVGKFCELG